MDFNDYIKTYEDLAKQVGVMVLANEIANRPLELINGDLDDEIFQFFIISFVKAKLESIASLSV